MIFKVYFNTQITYGYFFIEAKSKREIVKFFGTRKAFRKIKKSSLEPLERMTKAFNIKGYKCKPMPLNHHRLQRLKAIANSTVLTRNKRSR
jgi:hypothetical protein